MIADVNLCLISSYCLDRAKLVLEVDIKYAKEQKRKD
jgi:hypothetical protein